ncbi:hypothetical protein ACWKW6_12780 [Dyadobacter jiangsuensis]
MNINLRTIALLTDRLDNLTHALELPLPSGMHVEMIQSILPGIRDEIRAALIDETGDNPWLTLEDLEEEEPETDEDDDSGRVIKMYNQ